MSAPPHQEPLSIPDGAAVFAHSAAVNRIYFSKLEKGASYPGLEIIAKLATVLEVEPAELLRIPLG